MVYTELRFEWDPTKAASNLEKHGVSFEEATATFDDPAYVVKEDVKHSRLGENRMWLIGEDRRGRVLLTVYTERQEGRVYRLISVRPANQKERLIYEKHRNAQP